MIDSNWAVYRQDFTGNEFLVESGLTEKRAAELVLEYESHKHHQHYWCCQLPESDRDYIAMLRESLRGGSSLALSIGVLKNQDASCDQAIQALVAVKQVSNDEAVTIVQKFW